MENYLPYSKWNVLQSPCSPNGVCRHPSRCNFNTKLGPLVVGGGGGGSPETSTLMESKDFSKMIQNNVVMIGLTVSMHI